MPVFKGESFQDRRSNVLDAKKALLEKFKARPAADDPKVIAREAERRGAGEILLASFREQDVAAGRNVSGDVRLKQVVSRLEKPLVNPAGAKLLHGYLPAVTSHTHDEVQPHHDAPKHKETHRW